MVTGANQGLGYQTSLELAKRGATLYMVCRNKQRGQQAAEAVIQQTGNHDVHLKARSGKEGWARGVAGAEACLPCHGSRVWQSHHPAWAQGLHIAQGGMSSLHAARCPRTPFLAAGVRRLVAERCQGAGR